MSRSYRVKFFNGAEQVYENVYNAGDMAVVVASKKITFNETYVISEVTLIEDGMADIPSAGQKSVNIRLTPVFSEP